MASILMPSITENAFFFVLWYNIMLRTNVDHGYKYAIHGVYNNCALYLLTTLLATHFIIILTEHSCWLDINDTVLSNNNTYIATMNAFLEKKMF